MENVKKIHEVSPLEKKAFQKLLYDKGHRVDIDQCDPDYTRYYINKYSKIIAYMPLRKSDEGKVINTDLFISDDKNAGMAFPAMLADIITRDSQILDEHTKIIIYTSSESNATALKDGFGQPTKERILRASKITVR